MRELIFEIAQRPLSYYRKRRESDPYAFAEFNAGIRSVLDFVWEELGQARKLGRALRIADSICPSDCAGWSACGSGLCVCAAAVEAEGGGNEVRPARGDTMPGRVGEGCLRGGGGGATTGESSSRAPGTETGSGSDPAFS